MGLTIHYSLSTKIRDARDVHQRVEALHHRAMRAIAQIVGEWNTMIAGYAGQLKDQLGGEHVQSKITKFPNFGHLETEARAGESSP